MNIFSTHFIKGVSKSAAASVGLAVICAALWPTQASALPLFARQTGQNCVACHAGGQFPELTPYGRMFKLTGYTIGERTVPVSVMGLLSDSKVVNTSSGSLDITAFPRNGALIMPTASVFLGGKIADNVGAFVQMTWDRYASGPYDDGTFGGHSGADNIDIRYADRFVSAGRDLIVGVSANNNPSVSDPWNTASAWMQYVPVPSPGSSQFIDGAAPYPGFASGGNLAGLTAYAYWNRMVYAEVGAYGNANGLFSFMSAGQRDGVSKLQGINPYGRIALTHEWGAHNVMVGASAMTARIYDDPTDTSSPDTVDRDRDYIVDAQYQYLLDPHSVTAQVAYGRSFQRYGVAVGNAPDTTNTWRTKVTYTYNAKYGGSVGLFNKVGIPSVGGDLGTSGSTYEAFWIPLQNIRLGLQYTTYGRYDGASSNYDGAGRNPSDNNSLFFYVWAAY